MHGILSMLTDRIDEQVMDAAGPSLQVISNMAVGFDNIDVTCPQIAGVVVTNTPDVLTETTADLAFEKKIVALQRPAAFPKRIDSFATVSGSRCGAHSCWPDKTCTGPRSESSAWGALAKLWPAAHAALG